jgi:UDP-N-acetylglucosamine 2-epimerase
MPGMKSSVVSLVGARPQFIKIAPLAPVLSKKFRHVIVHSGQHYDRLMSDIFFNQLKIPRVDYRLSAGSGSHGKMTGVIMTRFEKLLLKLKPDMILVYGDTNTTLAGALAGAKLRIPIGHVEAGLRSYRRDMPEEINRLLTDHVARLLFCPTEQAIKNLRREGIKSGVVHSGDLMYELLDECRQKCLAEEIFRAKFGVRPKEYILATLHRAENADNKTILSEAVDILGRLNYPVIFPAHPRTQKNLRLFGLISTLKKSRLVHLIDPVSYLDNLSLIKNAYAVMTDSGGMQKEAVFLGTPCLTLRDETEWPETLKRGNYLVGLSYNRIRKCLRNLKPPNTQLSYKIGRKKPSEIIASSVADYLREF